MGAYRTVARCCLELCALGHRFLPADFVGEENLRKTVGEEHCAGTYLHGTADSRDMGDLCDYGYGAAFWVFGQSGRIPQRGNSGWNHAACSIPQGVWSAINSVRYFRDAPPGKAVLEMEGSLVCRVDFAGSLLVVGQGDCSGEQQSVFVF